jgi:hypothetical protein
LLAVAHRITYILIQMIFFVWNDKNVDHIAKHNVTPDEAEYVVLHPSTGYPVPHEGDKILARGQTAPGEFLQVIYVLLEDAVDVDFSEIDLLGLETAAEAVYVIHARPLDASEKSGLRAKRKRKGKRK